MTDTLKQEYTLRITNANKSELVIILYDLTLYYLNIAYHAGNDTKAFRQNLQYAQDCVDELGSSLDFDYEIAGNLYSLYAFATKELTAIYVSADGERLLPIITMINDLKEAYAKAAADDHSPSVMQNSQKVYAGLTYGKNDIDESAVIESGRGFLA